MTLLAAASTSAGELIAKVLPLAIGAAISPTVLIVVLVVLSGRAHPRARGAAYAAGAITVLLGLTVISLTVLRRSVTHRAGGDPVYAWIDLGAGVLLAVIGIRTLLTAPKPKKPRAEPEDPRPQLGRFFGIGVAIMLTNFSTLVLYVPAMKEVAIAHVGDGAKVLTVVLVLGITSILAWAPVLLDTVAPRAAARVLEPLNAFMTRHQRTLSVVVCFVFAVYFVVKGLRGL